jgi:hypothetical protein
LTNEEGAVPKGHDLAGLTNVFEWERDGTGSCRRAQGCIFLLSTGTSPDISFFLDASENGDDAFFASRSQLVPQDHGEVYEVYDAHQCTEAVPCRTETSTACTGTGCQGVPAAPPLFATPASATFAGGGNFSPAPVVKPKPLTRAQKLARALKACKKLHAVPKRARCERAAHREFGPVKHHARAATAANQQRTR